jgi:glycosyltransferase involved in cell wall biosynthesis
MLRTLHGCDVNIAPLELDNPFNEAKSELKWFEAALVEVPTIASATGPFRAAIEHSRTGMLAASGSDWSDCLTALVDDPELRNRIGAAARTEVLNRFGPAKLRAAAEAAYGLPAVAKLTAPAVSVAAGKRIDWIVPGIIIGSGGHRNILRAAHFLQRFGHDVGLHFTDTQLSAHELRDQVHQHFYAFDGEIRRYDGILRYSDALLATHWSTVGPALQSRGLTREVMYFVQDFEPLFAPMGTEYILAENTYRQGLYCITSGPWCERVLRRDFNADADHFVFPIDRDIYFKRERQKQNLNVVVFAKPEMPRRCFELAVMMLRELHRLMPGVEIVMYGSRNVNQGTLGFPVTLRAVLPTIADLAQMYADGDLGVVFSTTNPSLVPYEMMACGLPVVDLARPGNEANYDDRYDIALLGDPDPVRMARQVRDLLGRPEERAARSKAGLELVARMPDEEQMARRVESLILGRLAR